MRNIFLILSIFLTVSVTAFGSARYSLVVTNQHGETQEGFGGSINFGYVRIHSSQWQYVRLTAGAEGLNNVYVRTSGMGFNEWNYCPINMQPNTSCDIRVEFRPNFEGHHSGDLYIDGNGFHDSFWLIGWGERTPY